MNKSTASAVPQPVADEPWETPLSIPTDDFAVLTTLLPLATLLAIYGTILIGSLQPGVSAPLVADTLIARMQ